MGEKNYKFKYSNMDMKDYIKQREYAAMAKRREASDATLIASSIEEEMRILEQHLLEEDAAE